MSRIGSRALAEFPLAVVRIECQRCGRTGSYRLDGLMARFGPDIALPGSTGRLEESSRAAEHSQARPPDGLALVAGAITGGEE
jgi:hypothetical protein